MVVHTLAARGGKLRFRNKTQKMYGETFIKRYIVERTNKAQAARTVTKCRKTDHISLILRQLHWLPLHDRIHHKVLSATYLSVHGNAPLYLSQLFISTPPLALSDRLQDLSLMSLGQDILRLNDTVSEPSDMLPHLSGMLCLEASGKVIQFSPSKLL